MNKNLTDLTLIIDRSGSMASCRTDAEGGANSFIEDQKKQPGQCVLSLVQFDTTYDFVHRARPIAEIPRYTLVPRGNTALLDAVGKAINETGVRLANMGEQYRPGLVVFVIVTDGQENASSEFNRQQIKEMVEHQQKFYNWQFTFLGANQDAFAEAGGMGITRAATSGYSVDNAVAAFMAGSSNVKRMRRQAAGGQAVCCSYTEEEREEMK